MKKILKIAALIYLTLDLLAFTTSFTLYVVTDNWSYRVATAYLIGMAVFPAMFCGIYFLCIETINTAKDYRKI